MQRTGRLIVVHEAPHSFGVGAEIAARVTEQAFYSLEAPVARVTAYDAPYPIASIESAYLPSAERVLTAVKRTLELVA